ncbi:hypothetical protein FACS189472_14070 [Alphaproteobacteria bacterium]|nr:hypothetical protein FACS189472_14070 [Alphaproteobacteria bacterium]
MRKEEKTFVPGQDDGCLCAFPWELTDEGNPVVEVVVAHFHARTDDLCCEPQEGLDD